MTSLTFNSYQLSPVQQNNQTYLTSSDLAGALGYKDSKSVTRLYNANSEEFTNGMTLVIDSVTKGFGNGESKKPVRIFSLRGAHLIAMFSRTKVAKDFRKWVLDILDREVGCAQPSNELDELKTQITALAQMVHELQSQASKPKAKAIAQPNPNEVTSLPFVADIGTGRSKERSFWHVQPTGDYGTDCATGERYAHQAVMYIRLTGFRPLLGWVLFAMPNKDTRTGIEVGFLSEVSKLLLKNI